MGKRILTNKHNLPDTLVQAIELDTHNMAGTISVTQLIDGPQIRYLKKLHDYEQDVSDLTYALVGTALHHVLERANISSVRKRAFILTAETLAQKTEEMIKSGDTEKASKMDKVARWLMALIPVFFPETTQRYLFEQTERLDFGDHVISGTYDLFDKTTGILWDYKFCSTYIWANPDARKKWVEQLNIYAAMLRHNHGHVVTGIRVVAFFRDWNASGLLKSSDYPERHIMEIVIPIYEQEKAIKMINHYLDLHRSAENGSVPECSGEVRWAKADEYAVKTPSAKRAVRILDTEMAALSYMQENKHRFHGMFIEHRPGESRRCKSYCPVSKFCPQYKKELKKQEMINLQK